MIEVNSRLRLAIFYQSYIFIVGLDGIFLSADRLSRWTDLLASRITASLKALLMVPAMSHIIEASRPANRIVKPTIDWHRVAGNIARNGTPTERMEWSPRPAAQVAEALALT